MTNKLTWLAEENQRLTQQVEETLRDLHRIGRHNIILIEENAKLQKQLQTACAVNEPCMAIDCANLY